MDYRYLTEIKNEFNNFLCGILVPHLYHGIKGMLKYSKNVYNQIELKNKKGAKINNPGIIYIFKKTLDGISGLNNHEIEEEYLRIKNSSGCIEWFDNLVRASFKSYVLFLTWDPKISNSKYSDNMIYESMIIKDFIHKCYVISCNYFRDNPEIFISKSNKKEIFEILKMCIDMSIKKSLPYNQIIKEYLEIEFDKTNDLNSKEIQNIKTMVYNMINNKKYGPGPNIDNILIEDTGNDEFVNLEDSEFKKAQLENFINNEKIKEQNKNLNNKVNLIELDNVENIINENTNNNSGSTLLSRAEINKKKLDKIINQETESKNSITSNNMILEEKPESESEPELESESESESESKFNKSEKIETTNNMTSEMTNSKSNLINILSSPPAIRIKEKDRIGEIFDLNNKPNQTTKKNIKVLKHKNNKLFEKFDQVESFYDNMIKI